MESGSERSEQVIIPSLDSLHKGNPYPPTVIQSFLRDTWLAFVVLQGLSIVLPH